MNFIFISPNYPEHYWNFTKRLKDRGVNVLGIGDAPWDSLSEECRNSLCSYRQVHSLGDYEAVYRAVAAFAAEHGRIDYVESLNEYWLELDARLREDFNVKTGPHMRDVRRMTLKSRMKEVYEKAGVKTARWNLPRTLSQALEFAEAVHYPVILKPDRGVGATNTYKVKDKAQLEETWKILPAGIRYIEEEYIPGHIITFDGICDSRSHILVATSSNQPVAPLEVLLSDCDVISHCEPVPEDLKEAGEKVLRLFGVRNRFFHFEFFRLDETMARIGNKGDIFGLEVNMRAPGGNIPDQMNWAMDADVYTIWADSILHDRNYMDCSFKHYVTHVGRKEGMSYAHSPEEVRSKLTGHLLMEKTVTAEEGREIGNHIFFVRADSKTRRDELVAFILQKA